MDIRKLYSENEEERTKAVRFLKRELIRWFNTEYCDLEEWLEISQIIAFPDHYEEKYDV